MISTWDELDTLQENDEGLVQTEILDKKLAFDKIFLNCVRTDEGERMLTALRERLVTRPMYVKGSTLEETAYRQGMADVVAMIDKCVDDALTK